MSKEEEEESDIRQAKQVKGLHAKRSLKTGEIVEGKESKIGEAKQVKGLHNVRSLRTGKITKRSDRIQKRLTKLNQRRKLNAQSGGKGAQIAADEGGVHLRNPVKPDFEQIWWLAPAVALLLPWRIVVQGDDTVKVLDNGIFNFDGDDPAVGQFETIADSAALTVTGAGTIWVQFLMFRELINTDPGGSGDSTLETYRKIFNGTFAITFRDFDPAGGDTDDMHATTSIFKEIGAVDLDGDGNAKVTGQYVTDYFDLHQDTYTKYQ
jgi:hypothetical protein